MSSLWEGTSVKIPVALILLALGSQELSRHQASTAGVCVWGEGQISVFIVVIIGGRVGGQG